MWSCHRRMRVIVSMTAAKLPADDTAALRMAQPLLARRPAWTEATRRWPHVLFTQTDASFPLEAAVIGQHQETVLLSIAVAFVARCLLVLLFLPFSAMDKVINHRAAVAQARLGVGWAALAPIMLFAGLAIEVVMSLAILTGIADRLAALILAGYCIVTAVLWKQFWKTPDFRLKGASHGRDIFWDFLKNIALAGGFLMVTIGATASGVHRFLSHPLDSSRPYAVYAVNTADDGER